MDSVIRTSKTRPDWSVNMPRNRYHEPKPNYKFGDFILLALVFGIIGALVSAIWLHDWFHQPYLVSAGCAFVILVMFVLAWSLRSHNADLEIWCTRTKNEKKISHTAAHVVLIISFALLALYVLISTVTALI